MKVSLNTIKQYIDFELPPVDELVARINSQLGGVEEIIDLGAKYKDAKIVKVVECEKHPNADRLNVCKIDAGTGELVQVVCGAPNVHADMWAVWLPPESIVPATYDDAEPFTLGARELRGVMSYGMLAAADELAIGSDHEGILEIDSEQWKPSDVAIAPAVSFAQVYGLDDTIIDIENKMFTHRPDCFGQLGIAREIAGILGHEFKSPEWYINAPEFGLGEGLELEVFNDVADKVVRFMAVAIKDVTVKPSPLWLQCALVALGSKPINNIVDVTNYIMLLTAQPTHAYDYDKLRGNKLGARMARAGETVQLLNGKSYTLSEDDIVIADNEGVIGLGGIMGGSGSEVSADTKNIVLEVATFDMYAVRKTSMRHGVFTDALTRFNKGQSPLQNGHVMQLLMNFDGMNGSQASEIFDSGEDLDAQYLDNAIHRYHHIDVTTSFINKRLGTQLTKENIASILESTEIRVQTSDGDDAIDVHTPFWRTDLGLPEDIVEEVGRLYGFDKLPRELSSRSTAPVARNQMLAAKQSLRTVLENSGANEVLTYSFVHENVLVGSDQDPTQAFAVSNALSPDLQYYRLSVLPSLLEKVHMNVRAGHDEFMLYELGKVHHNELYDNENLPKELDRIAGVYTRKQTADSAPYYMVRRTVEQMLCKVAPGASVSYAHLDDYATPDFKPFLQMIAPFEPRRSAIVEIDGELAGIVGEPKNPVRTHFKLPQQTAMFELFLSPFVAARLPLYEPLSRFPSMQRDISFVVDETVTYAQLAQTASGYTDDTATIKFAAQSIYSKPGETHKTITLRFTLTPRDATLSADDAQRIIGALTHVVSTATDAKVA